MAIMASQARGESFFQANFLIFTFIFRGALVNATGLTLLLESFARKKRFSRGVLANTARSLRFFFFEALGFL